MKKKISFRLFWMMILALVIFSGCQVLGDIEEPQSPNKDQNKSNNQKSVPTDSSLSGVLTSALHNLENKQGYHYWTTGQQSFTIHLNGSTDTQTYSLLYKLSVLNNPYVSKDELSVVSQADGKNRFTTEVYKKDAMVYFIHPDQPNQWYKTSTEYTQLDIIQSPHPTQVIRDVQSWIKDVPESKLSGVSFEDKGHHIIDLDLSAIVAADPNIQFQLIQQIKDQTSHHVTRLQDQGMQLDWSNAKITGTQQLHISQQDQKLTTITRDTTVTIPVLNGETFTIHSQITSNLVNEFSEKISIPSEALQNALDVQ
jgi:hypothetical protein